MAYKTNQGRTIAEVGGGQGGGAWGQLLYLTPPEANCFC